MSRENAVAQDPEGGLDRFQSAPGSMSRENTAKGGLASKV